MEQRTQSSANRALTAVLMALSNYDKEDEIAVVQGSRTTASVGSTVPGAAGSSSGIGFGEWGVDGDQEGEERPVLLHGSHGILNKHHRYQHHNHNPPSLASNQRPGGAQSVPQDSPPSSELGVEDGVRVGDIRPPSSYPYNFMLDDGDNYRMSGTDNAFCTADDFLGRGFTAANWRGALVDGGNELRDHFSDVWTNIFYNDDHNLLDKLLLFFEFPMTVLRKVRNRCCVIVVLYYVSLSWT